MRLGLMLICFAVLAFGWYSLSGGADFAPETRAAPEAAAAIQAPASEVSALTAADEARALRATADRGLRLGENPDQATTSASPGQSLEATLQSLVAETPDWLWTVNDDRVILYNGPSPGFDTVLELLQGEAVEWLRTDGGDWVNVRTVDGGVTGWVRREALERPDATN